MKALFQRVLRNFTGSTDNIEGYLSYIGIGYYILDRHINNTFRNCSSGNVGSNYD